MADAIVSKLEKSIVDVLGDKFDPKDGEKRQARLKRLLSTAGKNLTDEQFDGLPEQAQGWYNAAAKASKAGKPIPEFPDAPAEEPAKDDKAKADKKSKDKKADKAKGDKKAKKDKGEKKERNTAPSAKSELVKLRLQNPDADIDDLVKKLEGKGHKLSEATVLTIDGHCRGVIRVAKEIGWSAK